jgi:hypothetical protein
MAYAARKSFCATCCGPTRASCRYFPFSGGGPPGNKYFENGAFASTETLFCRLHMKACLDVTADWLERPPPVPGDRPPQSERSVT